MGGASTVRHRHATRRSPVAVAPVGLLVGAAGGQLQKPIRSNGMAWSPSVAPAFRGGCSVLEGPSGGAAGELLWLLDQRECPTGQTRKTGLSETSGGSISYLAVCVAPEHFPQLVRLAHHLGDALDDHWLRRVLGVDDTARVREQVAGLARLPPRAEPQASFQPHPRPASRAVVRRARR